MTQDAKSAGNSHREAPLTIQHRKFLFISDLGSIGDLAFAVKNEGNEVKYNIRSEAEKEISDGFLEKAEDWEPLKNWADVIIFDRETYNRIKNIIIPNMFYGSDIGERWIRDADLLLTWGYLS